MGSDLGYCCLDDEGAAPDALAAVADDEAAAWRRGAAASISAEREAGSIWMEGTRRGGGPITNSG